MKSNNYSEWSLQYIFDVVSQHLLAQDDRSYSTAAPFGCAYRGSGGLKCAAGFLIPDDEYHHDMEGSNVWQVPFFTRNFSREQMTLIGKLQVIHDKIPPDMWSEKFTELAINFGLQFNYLS